MGEFVDTVLRFPVVVLTFALVVVVCFWLLVLFGASDVEALEPVDALGLGGVPATVALSITIIVAWFTSLVVTVLLDGLDPTLVTVLGIAGLAIAVVVGLLVTRLILIPLRKVLPDAPAASRHDFVGLVCVVRTGRVDTTFGQAEVTAADGSSAIVQVRMAGEDPLPSGRTAVIYDYDADGEFFWIAPVDLDSTRD
ncbi:MULTISPECIES: hypothetical protein [Actinokineospora]|uniref:DUF1449 family protein n=1 Tax=Actinokineospora fastidiosa TaxID=1816 RepID=A0A918L9J9_9PSEU|nr:MULTISPECIES: hypothetical protein [Actinokineospora]UVS82427.1 hypothetical protein Actkin_06199 [Actinokineospora sp. UTMC 2448]GGS21309.1 hypothetical protein GCM10010171_12510 [Actinokineospora fastidiosa]